MDNEQYYKEAMNKLTKPEDKEELEYYWHCFNDEGTRIPLEYTKNGSVIFGSGYICWEFPQWLEAACANGSSICNTLGLTGKYLLKIQLLCRLRDLQLPPEEDEKWADLITKDNVDVSELDLALKNLEISERKQALAEDFEQV